MINWKYLLVVSMVGSALFAQSKVGKVIGKVILKDKDGHEMEIKEDSKLTIEISPSQATEKLVLKNLFQVKIASDKQEVLLDVTQGPNSTADGAETKSNTGIYYEGSKELNKQGLHAICFANIDVKEKDLQYETSSVECIKAKSDCKAYTLGANKQFKMGEATICIGKRDVSISKTVPTYEEKIVCKFYDEAPKANNGTVVIYTHDLTDLKEKHVKASTAECK